MKIGKEMRWILLCIHRLKKMKLLIVDNDIYSVLELQRNLQWKSDGIDMFLSAENTEKAEQIITAEQPDIIISETEMSGDNGIRLIKWMRANYGIKHIVIFYTRYADFDYAQSAVKLNAFDYILKPAPLEEIDKVLQNAVEHRKKVLEEENRFYFLSKKERALEEKFYRGVIDGTIPNDPDRIAYMIRNLRLDIPTDSQISMVLFDQKQSQKVDRYLGRLEYEYCMKNMAAEIYVTHAIGFVHTIPIRNQYYLTIFRRNITKSKTADNQAMKICAQKINDTIHKMITAGVNIFYHGTCKMVECENQLSYLLEMAKRCRALEDCFCMEMPDNVVVANRYTDSIRRCYQWMLTANRIKLTESVNAIFSNMKNRGDYGYYQIEAIYNEYRNMVQAVLDVKNINLSALTNDIEYSAIKRLALNGPDSLYQWISFINEIIISVIIESDTGDISEKVKLFILSHLDENITRKMLAEHVYLNEDYLSRLFRKTEGMALSQYIAEVKTQRAMELLRSPAVTISEAAAQIGIDNFPYFSRMFKKQTGLSPSEYKKKVIQDGN